MSNTPRLNWLLFAGFLLVALGVTVGALVLPAFRPLAYAPLRELVLPPPSPVVVSLLYSTEKEQWLAEVVPAFEATHPQINGHPVVLKLEKSGSREMILAVLNQQAQPDLISPASSLQISILQDQSLNVFGHSIVNPSDAQNCRPVLRTPLVMVAWKERADVLWGDNPGTDMWLRLHDAVIDPNGWAALNHPEWGYVKFGHTDPLKSNSGFQAILLMTYGYLHKTAGLSGGDILSNPDYQRWFLELENSISDFGDSTGTYMKDMVAFGPSKYDLIAVYESVAIEQSANASNRYGQLRVYYPPATLWSDHPFCVVVADWVSPDQARAAQLFLNYLGSEPAQRAALLKYGFRPVDTSIPLDQPGSPFQTYAANGFLIAVPPEVEVPPGNVLNTLLDFWARSVQR
ncbi:MAG: substrate-binding domain-containing protein [Anaerolineales bacterium]